LVRPDNRGTTKVALSFPSPPLGYERLDTAAQKTILSHVFTGAGWEMPRILAAMAGSEDFYLELLGQIRLPRWSSGRVALVGDAGYCASPISGMGTSVALVGAYVLAGELARHDDHRTAFAAYEAVMRPYVTRAQKLPPGAPRGGSPRTRRGIKFQHAVIRLATSPAARRITGPMFSSPASAIELPDYSDLTVTGAG